MPRVPSSVLAALSFVPKGSKVARMQRYRRLQQPVPTQPSATQVDFMLDRVRRAEVIHEQWRGTLEEAYEIFTPQRNPFSNTGAGARKGREVLDSTAQKALQRWASRKQQQLVPPGRKYARLVPGTLMPPEIKEQAKTPLEEQTDILFSHLAISNAATEIHEALLDAGISTGAIAVLDSGDPERPLRFQACPMSELLVEESAWGSISDNVFRKRKLPVGVILRQWPGFDFHPDTMKVLTQDPPKPETLVEVVECCVENLARGGFDYAIIETANKHLGHYEWWEQSPWIVFGAIKLSDETYRRGPALTALADARTLERVKELLFQCAALRTAGLWKAVPSAQLDPWNITLKAGAIVPVTSMDDLEPLEFSGDVQLDQFIVQDLQTAIMSAMEVVDLGQIEEVPVRTATEIMLRDQEAAMDSASSSARLQSELVMQVVSKAAYVLGRRGVMAPIKIDGKEVDVEFEGPLSRQQDNEELLRVQQAMEIAAPFGPAVMTAVKPEVLVKMIFEKSGVWSEAIRSDQEIAKVVAAATAAMQAQAQAQQSPAVAPGGPPTLQQQAGGPPPIEPMQQQAPTPGGMAA